MEKDFIRVCLAILVSFFVLLIGNYVYTYANLYGVKSILSAPLDILYFITTNQFELVVSVALGIQCRNYYRLKRDKVYGYLYLLFQYFSLLAVYGVVDEFWVSGTRFSRYEMNYSYIVALFTAIRIYILKRKNGGS